LAEVQTSVIRDLAGLESISAEWDGLLDRSAAPEVFRTYEWMAAWWKVFGDDGRRQPLVVVVRQGSTLVGLAPFALHEATWGGRIRFRRLELMGTGEDMADEVCSYFGDIIAARGLEDEVCAAVWQFLEDSRGAWDAAEWPSILESSLLARRLRAAAQESGRATSAATSGKRFFLDLETGGFDGFLAGLSKKKMKRFQSYRRRLEKEGIGEQRLPAREDIPGFLQEMARLNQLRRGGQGRASAWGSAKFRRFHELVAPRLWEKGRLDLRVWKREDACLAALYHFLYAGTVYGYQIGFDTQAFGSVSPGLVAIGQSIEWAYANGCRRFDFLVSGDGSYKEDYPCLTEDVLDLIVYNDTPAGRLLRLAHQARAAFRGVRQRLVMARAALRPQPAGPPAEASDEDQARPAA
jgi:CelD/BcsL family acetyltransferase involved in cellulose biosynthesis